LTPMLNLMLDVSKVSAIKYPWFSFFFWSQYLVLCIHVFNLCIHGKVGGLHIKRSIIARGSSVMVSILVIRPRVRGFKPSRGDRILGGIEIHSLPLFGGEVKLEASCRKILYGT
jgi:hypothetical protein